MFDVLNKTFFKFLLGFVAIVSSGIALLLAVEFYKSGGESMASAPGDKIISSGVQGTPENGIDR